MGGQPHRSLPKKSHMQRFGFRRRSEELSSNFREDMAPISAAIVLQETKLLLPFFFFNFLKNESNLRWTAKGKWTAYYSNF